METEKHEYHFLAANASIYGENGFKELLDEYDENLKAIFWNINSHKIKEGDICYVYYSNLPDYTRRILFRGVVLKSDYPNYNGTSIYKKASPDEKYALIRLRSVAFEEPDKFSFDTLKKRPYNFLNKNTRQLSYRYVDLNKDINLINALEEYKNKGHFLKEVYKLFNDNYAMCFFKCKTFVEDNGFYYIERHHLVERNLIEKNKHIKDIDSIIDNPDNLFYLCPLCHRKIHHATKDVKRTMIKSLYKNRENFFDSNFESIKGNQSVLDWLYEMYKCEDSNRATLEKYVYNIIKKNGGKIPSDLQELLMNKDEFIKKRPTHAERSYIEFNNNLVLDTNISKAEKDVILRKLINIEKSLKNKKS